MKKTFGLFLVVTALLLGACTSMTTQNVDLDQARVAIKEGRDQDALRHLGMAENTIQPSRQTHSEIIFLRAGCYERLKRVNDAIGCYRYVIAMFPQSNLAYQAKERLKVLEAAAASTPASTPAP